MSITTRAEILTLLGISGTATDNDLGVLNLAGAWVESLVQDEMGFTVAYTTGITEYHPESGVFRPVEPLIDGYEAATGRAVPIERFRWDGRILQLRHLPVRTVQTVYEDQLAWDTAVNGVPNFSSGSQLFEGQDWQVDYREPLISWTGFLIRRTGIWSASERACRVVFTAGFTAAEIQAQFPRLKMAVAKEIMRQFAEIKAQRPNIVTGAAGGAITAEGLQGWNVTFDAEAARNNTGLTLALSPETLRLIESYTRYGKYL